jgi:UDP-N-acetylglucosamine acyltransferase
VKIHPTAVIDPKAKLGANVEIGPYSVIGPEVVLGDNNVLQSHVVLQGSVTMGSGNFVGPGTVIGGAPQDLSFSRERKTHVIIGNDNIFREYCTIHRGSPEDSATTIGDRNFFMVGAHLGHNCQVAHGVIIANNCLLAGNVRVDDQAFLGGGSTFHQHMRVGRLVMVQGSSAFGKDLPPFVLAAERNSVMGLNVIGLRRAGFTAEQRQDIKAAFKLLYLSGLNLSQALKEAEKTKFGELGREFWQFVNEAKKRAIVPYRGKGEGSDF